MNLRNLVVFAALAGCTAPVELDAVFAAPPAPPPPPPCPIGCFNSPESDHYGMHDLHLFGEDNALGVSLALNPDGRAELTKQGNSYGLSVEGGRLRGEHPGLPPLEGPLLAGAELLLIYRGEPLYAIHIDEVRMKTHVLGPPDPLEVYVLSWHLVGASPSEEQNVCAPPIPAPDPDFDGPRYLGLEPGESVVFEGDKIDADRITVEEDPVDGWFNIGCAGHSLSKLRLLRETTIDGAHWEGRQATLKMLAADYCGDGTPFTVAGERLYWMGGLMKYQVADDVDLELEARWSQSGADCVGTPRLVETTLYHPFGDIEQAIREQCEPPSCGNGDPRDHDNAYLVSANPVL